jgi:hypothetical protein
MNLFLDANILLNFYHYSDDTIEKLTEIMPQIEKGLIKLFFTDQVKDEYRRNREVKINDAFKSFSSNLKISVPNLAKHYDEYKKVMEHVDLANKNLNTLTKKSRLDAKKSELRSDQFIEMLFNKATILESTKEIIRKSNHRIAIGNPPGKRGSIGDAISWEVLMAEEKVDHLHLVSDDGDFRSSLDRFQLKEFLIGEWKKSKSGEIFYYPSLGDFLRDNLPVVDVLEDIEKEESIEQFYSSSNFINTHQAIVKLNKHESFSPDQLNYLAEAVINNDQISTILTDEDVFKFINEKILAKADQLDPTTASLLENIVEEKVREEERLARS